MGEAGAGRCGEVVWEEVISVPDSCICKSLSDSSHIAMGCGDELDDNFFRTVKNVKDFGPSKWWLYMAQCTGCQQNWLVAQEELIFDEYFLVRLSQTQAREIFENNMWPEQFSSYEAVLRAGGSVVNHCQFFDTVAWSLVWSAEELRKERPDITITEIAELLGITESRAEKVVAAI